MDMFAGQKQDFGCWRRVIYPVLAGASGNISLKAVCLYMAAHPCRERARGTQSDQTCFGFHIVVAATVCARTFGLRALNPEQTRNPKPLGQRFIPAGLQRRNVLRE